MPVSFNQNKYFEGNSVRFQDIRPGSFHEGDFSSIPENIKIFLDMDGVLTDFAGACEKLGDNMMLWYNSDKELFWKFIASAGIEFWSKMPWMTGGKELYSFIKNSGFCPTILSALPGPERKKALTYARAGKLEWLRKELGTDYAGNAVLCFRPEKALQSGVSRVLIDDNSENIHEWEEAGGIGILHKNADYTIHCFNKILNKEWK